MRLLCILSAVVMFVAITGCQTGQSEKDKKITKSLNEIKQKLVAINKQLAEIKEELEEEALPIVQSNLGVKGPDIRRLSKIKLAKNPSKEQVERYIEKIVKVSQGQNRFSSTDPQIAMLSKIASKHLGLLLAYAQNYYVRTAIPNVASKNDKKKILEALKVYPQLITCVIKYEWTEDAKEIIFDYLKNNTGTYLPYQWIDVAVQLSTPKEYAVLEKHFIKGNNPEMNYRALCQLEHFDMKKAVDKAWNYQKKRAQAWQKKQIAIIAAKFGHKDALKYLVYAYRIEINQHSINQIKSSLYQLTGQTLSPKKMTKWYKEHQAKLVFDPESEEYLETDRYIAPIKNKK